ncbi:riboflavin synthase [Candidatus Microgenomates bacterium]|nr:riboflavin synthase [Candidatus Microgenomates bacterium]
MFSGIVQYQKKAVQLKSDSNGTRLILPIPSGWKLLKGESIAIDGICMTIENIKNDTFSFFAMNETLRRTNLLKVDKGHYFNLERPLTLNSLIGGHLVSGHIDTTGFVSKIKTDGSAKVITIKIASRYNKYIIEKGSIAVNGVSLTVVTANKNYFVVSLIPYTLTQTNLGQLTLGDLVNIELDLIAKYLEKLKT